MIGRFRMVIAPVWNRIGCLSAQVPCNQQRYTPAEKFATNLTAAFSTETMTQVSPGMNLGYQDIVQGTKTKSIVLIDVREPRELQENGVLPDSVNIPLGEVRDAFQSLTSENFQKKYGIPLPTKDAPVVFSCHAGGRSMKALLTALELGYQNAKHYAGGFSDWKQHSTL